jgi:hypothetical protein
MVRNVVRVEGARALDVRDDAHGGTKQSTMHDTTIHRLEKHAIISYTHQSASPRGNDGHALTNPLPWRKSTFYWPQGEPDTPGGADATRHVIRLRNFVEKI